MSEITIKTFERSVAEYFEPLAREHGWPLARLREDVYGISSSYFTMRVCYEVGAHAKGLNATLLPSNKIPGCSRKEADRELGVRVIAGYNGVDIGYVSREQTESEFFEEAKYVAELARRFAVPYLIGEKKDWGKVQDYLDKLIAEGVEKIKSYKFPPFVQKRWHLPPPKASGDER